MTLGAAGERCAFVDRDDHKMFLAESLGISFLEKKEDVEREEEEMS